MDEIGNDEAGADQGAQDPPGDVRRPRRAAAAAVNQAWMPAQRGRGRGRGRGNLPPPYQPPPPPAGAEIEQQLQGLELDPIEGQQPQNQEGGAHNQGADVMSQPAAGVQFHPGADAAFIAVLANFQFSLQAINAILANGVISVNSLIGLNPKDIENIMTIVRKSLPPIMVNYISQKKLSILTYWVNRKHRPAETINLAAFTQTVQDE
jgi:hypothetical protein